MRKLSDEEIDFIWEDIRKRGVFTESLAENLLDHICCFIEEQPDDGRPFGEICRQAMESFGPNGLQEVQDETLFLINQKHLSKMKKLMYISGTFASLALIIGAMFKIFHWPGANLLLIFGTLSLTFLFSPFFFYMYFKEQTEKKGKVIAALGFATAIFLCLGAIFKIMHWPGASFMIIGFVLLFVVFLPLYMINGIRNPLTRFSSISNGFLLACIGGFMMLLSFQQPSKAINDSFSAIHENENKLNQMLASKWNAEADRFPIECKTMLSEFRENCTKALSGLPEINEGKPIGTGQVISETDLLNVQVEISAAVQKLNEQMKGEKVAGYNWSAIENTKLQPGQTGSIRFQVLQLENQAYLRALSMNDQTKTAMTKN